MKRLILHPDDRSTDFLKPIYSQLENTTVITGGLRRQSEIHELIQSHDQVIMLGHGFSDGLLSVRQFGLNPFIIDARCARYLSEKDSNIFIWCYASDFVTKHQLKGYCSGMFISEELEALYHGKLPEKLKHLKLESVKLNHHEKLKIYGVSNLIR
jgi:hypothetical protein